MVDKKLFQVRTGSSEAAKMLDSRGSSKISKHLAAAVYLNETVENPDIVFSKPVDDLTGGDPYTIAKIRAYEGLFG